MNKKIATALEGAIEKWQIIVNYIEHNKNIDFGVINVLEQGGENCPLCCLVFCKDCPIADRVGVEDCERTPYTAFLNSKNCQSERGIRKHAKAELRFLKSLRE